MDDLTQDFLEHWRNTHTGDAIKYFDASEGIPASAFNSIDEPAFPPKSVYQDFPTEDRRKPEMPQDRDIHFQHAASLPMIRRCNTMR